MQPTLNIGSYVEGYSTDHVTCFDLTIGGAAGFYNYDNYFFYNFYNTYYECWTNFEECIWYDKKNLALKKLGLEIQAKTVSDKEEFLSVVIHLLQEQIPVIMIVKYTSLFYYHEYKNDVFLDHAILINDYDSNNETFGIGETLFTKQLFYGKSEPFVRLQITKDMLLQIWTESNDIFKIEKENHPDSKYLYNNLIYYIVKTDMPQIIEYNDVVEDFVQKLSLSGDIFLNFIRAFNEQYYEIILDKNEQRTARRIYVNSNFVLLDVIEKGLQILKSDDELQNEFNDLKNKYIQSRDNVYSLLLASAIRKKPYKTDEVLNMIDEIKEKNVELFSKIKYLQSLNEKQSIRNIHLELGEYFNCKAFGNEVSMECCAKITHTGTYLLNEGLPQNEWIVGKTTFKFPDLFDQYDNISCKRQVIKIDSIKCRKIEFLGCAEFGHFSSNMNIRYKSGILQQLELHFSDFLRQPVYGEKIAWRVRYVSRKRDVINTSKYPSNIFACTYYAKNGIPMESIELPDCPNMHIFAITLVI